MVILDKPLEWYIEKLKLNEPFSIGMYGDGEWEAIFRSPHGGGENAENTIYTPELCQDLESSLRFPDPDFYFATSGGLFDPQIYGDRIKRYLQNRQFEISFYEKDMWDREVREMRFYPFIQALQEKNVVIISNKALRGLTFLNYDKFIEVGYPNCYEEISWVESEVRAYNKSGVYLIAMGLPAALMVQKLHGTVPNSWFLDLGSVWDAFVGIGAQRGWRTELYVDFKRWEKWKRINIHG